jgi:hypothetical protein
VVFNWSSISEVLAMPLSLIQRTERSFSVIELINEEMTYMQTLFSDPEEKAQI